jgi:hypothetical protein
MYVELVDPQGTLEREIADPRMKRDDVALTYAFALRQRADINWAAVNQAIISRWSLSGLKYIKESAWRRVEGR